MDFGLFYEICVPRPWDPGKEAQIIRDVVEQVRYAEEMGFRNVWLTEHHFLEEFSHCSAPEVLLGAFSQVTTEMRLGHGVVLTPPKYNHPARVAERCAMLDCLSNGRLEIGTGRSVTPTELDGFGIDANHARDVAGGRRVAREAPHRGARRARRRLRGDAAAHGGAALRPATTPTHVDGWDLAEHDRARGRERARRVVLRTRHAARAAREKRERVPQTDQGR